MQIHDTSVPMQHKLSLNFHKNNRLGSADFITENSELILANIQILAYVFYLWLILCCVNML